MKFDFDDMYHQYGEIMLTPALLYAREDYYRCISFTFLRWRWSVEWKSL